MRFPRNVIIYIGATAAVGLGLTAFCLLTYPIYDGHRTTPALALVLIVLMALCDRYGLHLVSGENIHVDTIPLFVSVLVLNPAQAIIVAGLGRAAGRLAGKRKGLPWAEHVFNVGQTLVYVGSSALALDLFATSPWRPLGWQAWADALLVIVMMYGLNAGIVAGIVSVAQRQSLFRILARAGFVNLWSQAIMFGFGLLIALVVEPYPWALVLAALPAAALFVALDRSLKAEERQKQLAEQNAKLVEHLSEQAEQLREAYAVLQDAMDAKNQMVQNVSHELRTPLFAISGYTEALQEGLYGPMPDQQHQALDVICRSTQQMIRLVDDLLSLQMIDRAQLFLSPVSVPDLLQEVADSFGQRAVAAGIRIHVDCSGPVLEVQADERRLVQVINNLVDNAIKFSPGGGDVRLEATSVDEDRVMVSVQDHGIGIPEAELPQIYRLFYQVDGSSVRRFGGQGLGLAIARRIVEIHGGTIRADSKLGEGTTFYITLPIAPPPGPLTLPNND